MPEDSESVSLAEYQKIQRALSRRDKAATKAEQRADALEASVGRLERLVEGLTRATAMGDPESQRQIEELLSQNAQQRQSDTTAAQYSARLNSLVDNSDLDWDDPKLEDARQLIDEIVESGDMSRAPQIEQLVKQALSGPAKPLEEIVSEAVERAIRTAGQHSAIPRVDTGSSSVRTGPVERSELQRFDGNLAEFKAKLQAAYSQQG